MAKNDMRIDVDFVDHPKTKRLIRMTGYEGFYCLMKLFSIAAKIYKTGDLKNCDSFDIEDLTGWTGEAGKLVEALTDKKISFLEKKGSLYSIHDWDVNQPWIYHAEERSEQAKKAINARWDKEKQEDTEEETSNTDSYTDKIRSVYETNTECNTPSPSPSPIPSPYPFPSPSPIPEYSCVEPSSKLDAEEPEMSNEPGIISIITNAKYEYPITQADIDLFEESYPGVNVIAELKRFKAWSYANPKKRKTKAGMMRAINSWLSREQDKAGSPSNSRYQDNKPRIADSALHPSASRGPLPTDGKPIVTDFTL
jgi:hypothetical protein